MILLENVCGIAVVFVLFIGYSCCVVAGRCNREEEERRDRGS
jgi:hypothetical protein